MYNAGERKDVRRAEKEGKIRERERLEVIKSLMSVKGGRGWMLEKLEGCHIFRTSFSTDPLQMAFMEGERRQGLLLLNDIMQSCPDQYILMMRERNERDAARDATTEQPRGEDGDRGDQEPDFDDGDTARNASPAGNFVDYTFPRATQ